MKNYIILPLAILAFAVPYALQDSFAIPVGAGGVYLEDPRFCDDHVPPPTLTHELGTNTFPLDETITIFSRDVNALDLTSGCRDLPGPSRNLQIFMINQGSKHWEDLFFVLDGFGDTIANPDGTVSDSTTRTLAFKIDNVGRNTPLLAESMNPDLIFEPGETWQFLVEGPASVNGLFINTIGFSSAARHGTDSNVVGSSRASILANEHFPDPPPDSQLIGGKLIEIDSTSLLLAEAQSFSWMIPVTLSILGIGMFVICRKFEN